MTTDSGLRLDIGAGWHPEPGYTTVDLHGTPDITAPMWQLPLPAGSVAEIRCVHALEHIPKARVPDTLAEWHRVLTPAGRLLVEVPDLVWCCEQWLTHQTDDWWMDILFGSQEHEGQFHRTGFTIDILTTRLMEAGFELDAPVRRVWSHEQWSLRADAHRSEQKENHS